MVADNGSTDNSVAVADAAGARVVHQPRRGYGNAYMKGFSAARLRPPRSSSRCQKVAIEPGR
ncbi:MAG: glycosyltransferase [Streptosporangiaceae bacterium]